MEFRQDLWLQKTGFPAWAIVLLCLSGYIFSRFDRTPKRVTDRRTDTDP